MVKELKCWENGSLLGAVALGVLRKWVCVFAYVVGTRQRSLRRKCHSKNTTMHKGFSEC